MLRGVFSLRASYGREHLLIRLGGSLPVAESFQAGLGVKTICLA